MKLKLLICSLIVFAVGLLFSGHAYAYSESYLKGRAIQLANFSPDELVIEPKLVFNLSPVKQGSGDLFSLSTRVINLLDPRFSPSGISAVFEAPKYQIIDQNHKFEIYSFKRGIGDILKDGGVELAKEDIVSPGVGELQPAAGNVIKIKNRC